MLRSLRWRIPFFVCALIVMILTTFLVATHREIERTLVRAARDRATAAAEQFTDALTRGMRANIEENTRLSSDPAIRALVATPGDATREAALNALAPRSPGLFRRVEIWTDAGLRILEISTPGKSASGHMVSFPSETRPNHPGVSELRASGDLAYFDVTSEIREGSSPESRRLGYLRRYGRVTFSGNLKQLIGDSAIVRVGSTSGAWTDMVSVAGAPPAPDARSDIGEHQAADGEHWVGASGAIEGTPLVVWLGFPRSLIVRPAQAFMRRMILLAVAFVAVSVALIAFSGIRLAKRVQILTGAADEIAAGNYTRRVPAGRHDEIGGLTDAFNAMADRVEKAHRALRQSHEQTHFTLAAARIGVWEAHLATGRMTCSETVAATRGLTPDALPGTIEEFLAPVHPDDRESVRRVLEGGAIDDDVFEISYRILRPDRSTRWIEAKGRRMPDERGQPASVFGVSVDVTEQRRLESQLRQTQKMEAVGQLAGGVAHDFNNLLTAIVGHGNLVLEQLPEHDRLREDVIDILKAGERAAGLTRQLLAFSRRQVMQPEVIAVNAVVSDVEKLLRRLIGEHIDIILDLAASTDAVKVDPGQLEQVLVNLAVNARDAMPDGGALTIATTNVDLTEADAHQHSSLSPGRYVMMAVTDTGTGMDAETQAHLFEPFFTTKPAGKGTGLGLATVYGIVKQSGGSIYAYSEPEHGATFKIYLPATTEKPTTAGARIAPAKPKGGSETILVVEDNPHVQTIARRFLAHLGYRVLVASSGEEALRLLDAGGPRVDLVISDVIMPGMTGPELCRQLSTRYHRLRVLFTSGYSGDAIVRHGVLEPETMFIEKPYTPGALARKVREALGDRDESSVAGT